MLVLIFDIRSHNRSNITYVVSEILFTLW